VSPTLWDPWLSLFGVVINYFSLTELNSVKLVLTNGRTSGRSSSVVLPVVECGVA